ncbi:hypothetical protein I553_5679 [Mycobacterium xenopi 4042]|uniref:Uncharacterized protein n=1 Tax=Mycobacterium xenopi 4042 TaxID=1299334 RepID=X7ZYQ0_MYCXE|nr:hypothetical protein I553_5679 [Mycobacterium xenopi 4042]
MSRPVPPHRAARSASSPGWVVAPGSSSSRCALCIVTGLQSKCLVG